MNFRVTLKKIFISLGVGILSTMILTFFGLLQVSGCNEGLCWDGPNLIPHTFILGTILTYLIYSLLEKGKLILNQQ